MNRKPTRYIEFEGKSYTSGELEELTGYTRRYINELVAEGAPIRRKGEYVAPDRRRRWQVGDEMLTAFEIAARVGVSVEVIYSRLARGSRLDAPVRRGRSSQERALLESGEYPVQRNAGENGLYWADDLECRVWHLHCGGDDFGECTLAEISLLWNLSRERVRQIERDAIRKIRGMAARGNKDALEALACFRARAEARSRERPNAWEQASLNAPGHFDLSDFRNNTSYVDIARRFGHAEYETQPHVVASHAAAERRRRRSA